MYVQAIKKGQFVKERQMKKDLKFRFFKKDISEALRILKDRGIYIELDNKKYFSHFDMINVIDFGYWKEAK